MTRLWIIFLWVVTLFVDGVVLPGLGIGPAGFGTIIFLIALALTFGVHRWVVGWGIAIALIAEILLGLYFGTLVASWLVIAVGWYSINRFFSMKASDEQASFLITLLHAAFGILLFIAGEASQWLIIREVYQRALSFSATRGIISSPAVLCIALVELIVLLLLFRLVPARNPSKYA